MTLPNKLTLTRIAAVPVFILCYFYKLFFVALIIFILASITDLLDGKIARRDNLVTDFGKIMDPLADKILVYSALVLMVEDNTLKAWVLLVILAREFLVAGIRTVSAAKGKDVAAVFSGKLKTVFQMGATMVLLFAMALGKCNCQDVAYYFDLIGHIGMYVAVALTIYSGVEITIKNKEIFEEM
ncbi:MAG: CDP-diacylglycerol--glycerol-3-phosphate 3-phosphatidyltransferase [Clostridia bacterium]|nr:CDP-diacylglycerol--glycerol-3-phosphate 3-phosphatidyltransferase [Clostridia bacterium]